MDLVIDHSVQVDVARSENAVQANMELEFQRNKERFAFLKWGSTAFQNMLVVPPGSGIVHQVILLQSAIPYYFSKTCSNIDIYPFQPHLSSVLKCFFHLLSSFIYLEFFRGIFCVNLVSVSPILKIQVNLEYLGRVVFNTKGVLYPDSVVGTDSHTTMIDGLGVAGWGVGGIEAEATMLGQVKY